MPYITQGRRINLQDGGRIRGPGELNYMLTRTINDYFANAILDYETYNSAIGALECAKLELYRRLIAPYEDTKIRENGDVYAESPQHSRRAETD